MRESRAWESARTGSEVALGKALAQAAKPRLGKRSHRQQGRAWDSACTGRQGRAWESARTGSKAALGKALAQSQSGSGFLTATV